MESLALNYPPESFADVPVRLGRQGNTGPTGRSVAGLGFLQAYLAEGNIGRLVPLVANKEGRAAFEQLSTSKPRQYMATNQFHKGFFPSPPANLLHSAGPPNPAHAWARATHGPHSFALSGTIHSLPGSLQTLLQLATSPLMPYDSLVCASTAQRAAVETLFTTLRAAIGATLPGPRLEVIPWGIDAARHRPATAEQRATARAALAISPDEVVVLSVGRLAFHARANPYPLFHGLYHAARRSQKKVRLLLVGWAANEGIQKAILDGARVYAPTVTTSHLLGDKEQAYHAADLYADFADSLQQSHGLAILEAMACALPVVTSDWAGQRDLVEHERTGLLVPVTVMPTAADSLTRLLLGELPEEGFLAQTSQAVVVDPAFAVQALATLLADPERARSLGLSGRQRVEREFTWSRVVQAHDHLWSEQDILRDEFARKSPPRPVGLPTPEHLFQGYPTRQVGQGDRVQTVADHETMLHRLCKVPMTAFAAEARCTDLAALRAVLDRAASPVDLSELERVLDKAGVGLSQARATLAWMLKYGLLARV